MHILITGGCGYIGSNIVNRLKDNNNEVIIFDNDTFEGFLQQSASNSSINAYKHHGIHITVNTLSELEEAQKNIKNIIIE